MRNFFKSTVLSIALLFASVALAQYPTSPNTGKQTTQFNSNQFSALFNGPVTVSGLEQNTAKTSQYRIYSSTGDNGVVQVVELRYITVNGNIPVDYTSSDFYANEFVGDGIEDVNNRSQNVWEGHPFTYTFITSADKKTVTRSRFIIVNGKEALFIMQISPISANDRDQWLDFEYSLRIK